MKLTPDFRDRLIAVSALAAQVVNTHDGGGHNPMLLMLLSTRMERLSSDLHKHALVHIQD